jgi:hypothetical protein
VVVVAQLPAERASIDVGRFSSPNKARDVVAAR